MRDEQPIKALRQHVGLKQAEFMVLVGVGSEGHLSDIERGIKACPFDVALRIEELGRAHDYPIDAAALNEEVRRARETAQPPAQSELTA